MLATNAPQPDDTPTVQHPTTQLDPVDVARIVNVAWSVTRDRLERESRRRSDWSDYFLQDPSRIERVHE